MNNKARPTSGKVLSALFSILRSASLNEADFLDLFSGTGAVAMEALEQGARSVLCVESDGERAKAISARFSASGFSPPEAACIRSDARRVIPKLAREPQRRFGVTFADPPYCLGWGKSLPALMAQNWNIVSPGGVFVFEHSSREEASEIFGPRDDRIYGETVLSFYWKKEERDS
jgi:16S rRNA (guanine(966)-N(2))-methyltransferase RsmD